MHAPRGVRDSVHYFCLKFKRIRPLRCSAKIWTTKVDPSPAPVYGKRAPEVRCKPVVFPRGAGERLNFERTSGRAQSCPLFSTENQLNPPVTVLGKKMGHDDFWFSATPKATCGLEGDNFVTVRVSQKLWGKREACGSPVAGEVWVRVKQRPPCSWCTCLQDAAW